MYVSGLSLVKTWRIVFPGSSDAGLKTRVMVKLHTLHSLRLLCINEFVFGVKRLSSSKYGSELSAVLQEVVCLTPNGGFILLCHSIEIQLRPVEKDQCVVI